MLMRSDPFRDVDRLAEQLLGSGRTARWMPMDVYRSGDHFVLHLDLPGVDPASVDVQVQDEVLTVKAVRPERSTDGVQYLVSERPTGEFTRQLVLGNALDVDKVAATYDAGVLTITIPVAETAKPRRIQVASTGSPRVIEGRTQEQELAAAGSAG